MFLRLGLLSLVKDVYKRQVLSQKAQFELFKHFGFQSGRDTNKFEAFEQCARGTNGIYYITEGTNAYISVTVTKTEDLGSHTMFIGEITDMEVLSNVPSVKMCIRDSFRGET